MSTMNTQRSRTPPRSEARRLTTWVVVAGAEVDLIVGHIRSRVGRPQKEQSRR